MRINCPDFCFSWLLIAREFFIKILNLLKCLLRVFDFVEYRHAEHWVVNLSRKDACHVFMVDFMVAPEPFTFSTAFYRDSVGIRVLFLFSLSFPPEHHSAIRRVGIVTWNYASSFPWVSERIAGVIVVSRYFDEIELPSTTKHNARPCISPRKKKKILSFRTVQLVG